MSSTKKYECIPCDKKYTHKSGLDRHKRNDHNEDGSLKIKIKKIRKVQVPTETKDYKSLYKSLKIKYNTLNTENLIKYNTIKTENLILQTKLDMFQSFQPQVQPQVQPSEPIQQCVPSEPSKPSQLSKTLPKDDSEVVHKIALKKIKDDPEFYYNYFKKCIDYPFYMEGIQPIACKLYSLFFSEYVQISDKKRFTFKYINDNDKIITCDLLELDFLVQIIFEPFIQAYTEYTDNITYTGEEDEAKKNERVKAVTSIYKNPEDLLLRLKSIFNHSSKTTASTLNAARKMFE